MEYYKIILWNKIKGDSMCALTKAEDFFDAESKGKMYSDKWNSQGFEFYEVSHISDEIKKLEEGETIYIG